MEEKTQDLQSQEAVRDSAQATPPPKKGNAAVEFLANILRGVAIGVAFIIPGFSGGSVAAILGIYEKLVGSIADLFKHFRRSFLYLLPIAIGMLIGVAALIYPIQLGLRHYPIPTVTLFVGLALGGLPSVTDKMKGGRPSWKHFLALAIPLVLAAGLCFLPLGQEVDLFSLNVGEYFLLVLIGIVGSAALVVPGISGSMLLLIFGYYNPVVQMVTGNLIHGTNLGTCALVLGCLAVGVVIGFFAISVLMKVLLKKFPRGTHFAIFGFIVGSIPAVYVSTLRQAAEAETSPATSALLTNPWYWVVAVVLLLVGAALSLLLIWLARRKQRRD